MDMRIQSFNVDLEMPMKLWAEDDYFVCVNMRKLLNSMPTFGDRFIIIRIGC